MQMLKVFENNSGDALRVTTDNDNILFSLKDLMKILSLSLPMKDVKAKLHHGTTFYVEVEESKNETFVSEQALYKLFAMSDREDIPYIVDWISKQVIPLMKTYDELKVDDLLIDPLRVVYVLQKLENQKIEIALLKNKLEIQEMHEKVYQNMYGTKETVPLSGLAKYLKIDGINQNRLLEILRAKQIVEPNDMPYQKFIDKNYFQVVTHSKSQNGEQEVRYTVIVFKTGINFIRKLLIRLAGEKNE